MDDRTLGLDLRRTRDDCSTVRMRSWSGLDIQIKMLPTTKKSLMLMLLSWRKLGQHVVGSSRWRVLTQRTHDDAVKINFAGACSLVILILESSIIIGSVEDRMMKLGFVRKCRNMI